MEGKVELSVDRYEQLREIERNADKVVFVERVSPYGALYQIMRFEGKDETLKKTQESIDDLRERNDALVKEIARIEAGARYEITSLKNKLFDAPFMTRLSYILKGKIDD